MFTYENKLWQDRFQHVAGVDEAGRGCLFGDVVAAAVIMPPNVHVEGIDDSKKLTEKKREALYELIQQKALAIGVGRVDARTIDRINIKQAARLAMKRAIEALAVQPQYILSDAETIDVDVEQLALVKGDQLSHSIAAASIIAKVTRDRLCEQWDLNYPGYGIAQHKGYATAAHRKSIVDLGPSEMHRRSFLTNILNEQAR